MIEATSDLRTRRVGEIAAQLAGASAVFRRFDIEFCCQGHVALIDAIKRRNLDPGEVEAALNALAPMPEPQTSAETGQLIDHIKTRYHDRHRHQIPDLIALSDKVESVHVNHPKVPAGLARTLQQFLEDLDTLMTRQEQVDFPALLGQAPGHAALSIRMMRHDHNEHAVFLDQIDRLTDDCRLPEDACASWQALYTDLAAFKADLTDHIHLENNVLFPRFEVTTHD